MTSNTIPYIYFWYDEFEGKKEKMTAAVQWNKMNWGLSFPVEDNVVMNRINKSKLVRHMAEIVSVLVLHGKQALDKSNQIDPKLLNEQEAIRYKFDPIWDKRVKAVDKLTRVKDITQEEAKKLKLI